MTQEHLPAVAIARLLGIQHVSRLIPHSSSLRRKFEERTARTIALNTELVACEVECWRPEIGERSAQRESSFTLTVLASPGNDKKVSGRLAASDRVVIIDVLRLLDAPQRNAHA